METEYSESALLDKLVAHFEMYNLPEIMRLMSSSTFVISLDEPDILDVFTTIPDSFISLARKAIIRIKANYEDDKTIDQVSEMFSDLRIKLSNQKHDTLSSIDSSSINSPVSVRAVIVGLDEQKSYIIKAHFECPNEHDRGSVNIDVDLKRNIPSLRCQECNSKLLLDPDSSKYDYLQHGAIQEPPEDSKNMAASANGFDIIFTGDQIRDVVVGERKDIVGILRSIYNPKENEHSLVIDTLSINNTESVKELTPTPEEVKKYKEDALKPDYIKNLTSSFAPEILSSELLSAVKKSIILAMIGGVKIESKRADINLLMLGDPSVAKSSLLLFANKLVRKSMYSSGRGASAAGLTIGIVKRPNGTSLAQPGVLPLCHGGFAFIDELDKMNPLDRTGLHEAMEKQTCSINKAGFSMTLPAETSIIAAANPKGGKWIEGMGVIDNVNLPPTLLSRFDLRWRILDVVGINDTKIAEYITNSYMGGVQSFYSIEDLSKIINYTRKIRPTMSPEATKLLVDFYVEVRNKSAARPDEQVIIDTRQLEGLVRLTFANTKLHFRDVAGVDDARVAIALYTMALESFGFNLKTGEVHQNTFEETDKEGKTKVFWIIWSKHIDPSTGRVKDIAGFIDELLKHSNWNIGSDPAYYAEQYIQKLVKDSILTWNREGYMRVSQL